MARRPVKNCKCYTLSVLTASLAVTAAVSVVLVEMSPAHIYFFISKATYNTSSNGRLELTFTIAANNTSPRVSVLYRSIYILVCNGTNRGPHGLNASACIGTDVAPMPPLQEPKSTELIYPAVEFKGSYSPWESLGVVPRQDGFLGDMRHFDSSFSVKVATLVWFKRRGIPWTSLHGINATCSAVRVCTVCSTASVVVCASN